MKILYLWLLIGLLIIVSVLSVLWVYGSSDKDDPTEDVAKPVAFEPDSQWVYGKIEYLHDLLHPNCYFMLLRAHPGAPVPMVEGGYATTDVWVTVKLRGVEVARALQTKAERGRPHDYLSNERRRWDRALSYVWGVVGQNKLFRVHNLAVQEPDKVLVGDIEFMLGGQWHLLSAALLNDFHALPEGGNWEFGALEFGATTPNIPK